MKSNARIPRRALKARLQTEKQVSWRGAGGAEAIFFPRQRLLRSARNDARPLVFRHALSISFLAGLLSLILTLPAHAQQNGAAPQKLNPYTGKAEAISEGEALYKKFNCYACHGMKGGGGMGPNLTDETWQTGDGSDANVQTQIRDGRGAMPPYKSLLTDDQIWKLIAFVRSLYAGSPEKVRW